MKTDSGEKSPTLSEVADLLQSNHQPNRLLTLPEVADYLGVPLQSVYQWRTRGEGPRGIKVGRHVRVRRSDLDAWLDAHADPEPAA